MPKRNRKSPNRPIIIQSINKPLSDKEEAEITRIGDEKTVRATNFSVVFQGAESSDFFERANEEFRASDSADDASDAQEWRQRWIRDELGIKE